MRLDYYHVMSSNFYMWWVTFDEIAATKNLSIYYRHMHIHYGSDHKLGVVDY